MTQTALSFAVHRIFDHPSWPEVAPFIRIEEHGKAARHKRIEVRPMPSEVREKATAIITQCAACGELIHPIRQRKAAKLRGEPSQHCFYSGTCSLERPGCSKTKAAHEHHETMVRVVEST